MIEMLHITKEFPGIKANDDITLQLRKGEVHALLGENGAGKSTLMKAAAGLVKINGGTLTYKGQPIGTESKKHIAYMSTEPFYYDYMRIRDVKAFHKDFFADFDADLFDRLLTFMELTPDLKVRALSSGMAAKLKIAVTLSRRAEVIMLDEPLNGIDLIGRDQIIHTIIQATGSGATFIISSHLFDELEPIVDNVVMMKGGKVILEGELEAIRAEHGKSISDLYREIYADTAVPQF